MILHCCHTKGGNMRPCHLCLFFCLVCLYAHGCHDLSDDHPDSIPEKGTDLDTDSSNDPCTGLPDFTLCELETVPDRSYDICIDGTCVSPGGKDRSFNVPGPFFGVANTGLTLCYGNKSTPIECPGQAETEECGEIPFCGQDAQYQRPMKNRFTRNIAVEGEPIVADALTGLTWQGCTFGRRGEHCDEGTSSKSDWSDAFDRCETLNWGGFQDWRLPSTYELESIFNRIDQDPSIDPEMFPDVAKHQEYWTSSYFRYNQISSEHEYQSIDTQCGESTFSTYPSFTLCVRGAPLITSPERFKKSEPAANQPVVQDNITGLIWQGCPAGLTGAGCDIGQPNRTIWEEALSYCQNLNWGNSSNWRLPNLRELRSIANERRISPSIDVDAFPNTKPSDFSDYWTSTTNPFFSTDEMKEFLGQGYVVDFYYGHSISRFKIAPENSEFPGASSNLVRCVAGGI